MRILVVEDDEDSLVLVLQILEKMLDQTDILTAEDGHEAIRMAHEYRPDLIVLDLTLPKLSGWEVARSIRSSDGLREVPILALTAHAMIGDRDRALEAGCNDYYPKPIDIDTFLAFMRRYLE